MSSRSRSWLRAAAIYNLVAGTVFVLAGPTVAWKCIGMVVLVYAPGYWLASKRPNPDLVLVGLLGKVLGPLGFIWAAATGRLPVEFGLIVLANDLLWWPAFVRYLRETWGSRPVIDSSLVVITSHQRRRGRTNG